MSERCLRGWFQQINRCVKELVGGCAEYNMNVRLKSLARRLRAGVVICLFYLLSEEFVYKKQEG